jgi:prolyl oligopeptidase
MSSLFKSVLAGLALSMASLTAGAQTPPVAPDDLWLEEVEGERALNWVRAQNARSLALLEADSRYERFRAASEAILQATDRVPMPTLRGGRIYNFWQDAEHVRGLWRRTTLESYRSQTPQWEVLLDVDALTAAEKANWVFKGSQCAKPDYRRCLISLSNGGKDAVEIREFDVERRAFIEDGFRLPQGKQDAAWETPDRHDDAIRLRLHRQAPGSRRDPRGGP